MSAQTPTTLKFSPLQSCVDVSFWSELSSKKLDEYKLSEQPISITAFLNASRHEEIGSLFLVLADSFSASGVGSGSQQGSHALPGRLILTNTIESFKQLDKAAALQAAGAQVWADIASGAAEQHPELLSRFLLLAYGDLKHFVFHYWFAFPALKPPQPYQQLSAAPLAASYPQQQLRQAICAAADAWRARPDSRSSSAGGSRPPDLFCLMKLDAAADTADAAPLSSWKELTASLSPPPAAAQGAGAGAAAGAAQGAAQGPGAGAGAGAAAAGAAGAAEVLVVMFDPCQLPLTPGWPLRNLLLLAAARWGVRHLKLLAVRDSPAGRACPERCYVLEVALPELPAGWPAPAAAPQAVGWEADAAGKLLPRCVDVSSLMSPVQLAEQAVDLNLRLMRWRAAPGLDVTALAATRCLLLGAGTLGCAVARTLLAWGIRKVTFVDSSRVSYSNPVRQSLFVFQDCLQGGKPKAEAAAAALRDIFPSVDASGVALAIPMPGHPPANPQQEQEMQQAAEQLERLVAAHDVIFLLTDTRESRWLPTLLAAAHQKLAITAALGFDNFVVMRHGLPPPLPPQEQLQQPPGTVPATGTIGTASSSCCGGSGSSKQQQEQRRLGCYFCNDVVAPLNSTIDRTLDQQCTVARPGLAPVAGALAVELMAAVLQHPLQGRAPASSAAGASGADSGALGLPPHMIRGQLTGFSQVNMEGQAFSQCTACSTSVLQRCGEQGVWGFLRDVLQQPGLLEELTGLAELHRQTAAALAAMEVGSEEDEAAAAGDGGRRGADGEDDDWTEL